MDRRHHLGIVGRPPSGKVPVGNGTPGALESLCPPRHNAVMLQRKGRVQLVPLELKPVVDRELQAGEQLVWFGTPNPRNMMLASLGLVLFGIPWTAFALFWTGGAFVATRAANAPFGLDVCFPLFGVPFILVGLGMLSSPFWMRRRGQRTAYLLTDRRAVIIQGGLFGSVTTYSFQPERLTSITRLERKDGSGDLVFEEFTTRHGSGHTTTRRGFIGIANVRAVEEQVNQLVAQWRNTAPARDDQV